MISPKRSLIKRVCKRLTQLSIWLKDYRIGDLWMSGQLGGVRW